ncbi:hypothetical protein NUACC21_37120 [Scytonema sp. NUACC21]
MIKRLKLAPILGVGAFALSYLILTYNACGRTTLRIDIYGAKGELLREQECLSR